MATIDFLREEGLKITAFFYNPNIEPTERQKRKEAWETVCKVKNVQILSLEGELDMIRLEAERCSFCFDERLAKTSITAKKLGFKWFTTSLLISSYQKHDLLKKTGLAFEGFKYFDLRHLNANSQTQAKTLGVYRQKYCGCPFSLEESKWLMKRKEEICRPKQGPCEEWKPRWL